MNLIQPKLVVLEKLATQPCVPQANCGNVDVCLGLKPKLYQPRWSYPWLASLYGLWTFMFSMREWFIRMMEFITLVVILCTLAHHLQNNLLSTSSFKLTVHVASDQKCCRGQPTLQLRRQLQGWPQRICLGTINNL